MATSTEDLIRRLEDLFVSDDQAAAEALVQGLADADPAAHALGLAALAAHRKDADGTTAAAARAAELLPDDPGPAYYQAVAELLRDRLAAVPALLRPAAERTGSPRLWNFLGNTLLGLGRAQEAAAAYQQVLGREPANVQALNGLGAARARLRDLDGAVPALARAFCADPLDQQPLHSLMNVFGDAGRVLGALALLDLVRGRFTMDKESQAALALMRVSLCQMLFNGRFPEPGVVSDADDAVAEALRETAGLRPAVRLAAARILCDVGRLDDAQALLGELGEALDPEDEANRLFVRGLIAAGRGDSAGALLAYTGAVDLSGARWDAATNAISLLLDSPGGLTAESRAQIAALLGKVPAEVKGRAPQILYNEAIFLREEGRRDEARHTLERARAALRSRGDAALAELVDQGLRELSPGPGTTR